MPRFALALLAILALAAPASAAPGPRLRLGSVELQRCDDGPRWWCGTLRRPLDPARPDGRRIGIDFRWLAARHPAAAARRPALVAVEGGPGYPSTGSRAEFTGIFGPLLRERNLLLVDNRGTGTSALIDCPRLQPFSGDTSAPRFPRLVAECGRWIARRYGRPDLFATAYAVRDLAAVLRALRLGRVDLYGDSYGSFFVQSFISRHQDLLHSVVLDSTYPVRRLDPWYASSGVSARAAMDAVCARDPGCPPGRATARLGELVARLRVRPIAGSTRDSDGSRVRLRVGVRAVVDLVQDAASDPTIYRELDASVRAALAGDEVPLLRLVAQSRTYLHGPSEASYFSNGLYVAVACKDYPQLFAMRARPATRRAQLGARLMAPPPGAFDPFTAREWLTVSAYTQPYTACLEWPRPERRAPVVPRRQRPLPASVPLLVVGGDLDSLTPLSDAELFGPSLGERVRVIRLPNTVHVESQDYTIVTGGAGCAQRVIRAFVRAPARLRALDASCADGIPALHTAGAYPRRLADATPATLVTGPDPGLTARRAVTVAAGALADAPIRNYYSGVARGPGLRGGSFRARGAALLRLRFRAVRFVEDATVEGTGSWRAEDGAARGNLVVRAPDAPPVRVRLAWTRRARLASARVGDATLSFPAP